MIRRGPAAVARSLAHWASPAASATPSCSVHAIVPRGRVMPARTAHAHFLAWACTLLATLEERDSWSISAATVAAATWADALA